LSISVVFSASQCWWDNAAFRVARNGRTALDYADHRLNSVHAARREPQDFPAGLGPDETFYARTAWHGFKLVAA
jgi:hypothetical protein